MRIKRKTRGRLGGRVPVADMLRSFPNVGVDAVLCKVMEEMEEELSARARGAKGGGLPETGGLKGRDWRQHTAELVIIFTHISEMSKQRVIKGETESVPGL